MDRGERQGAFVAQMISFRRSVSTSPEYKRELFSNSFPFRLEFGANLDEEKNMISSAGRTRGVFDEESYKGCEKFRAISD